MSGLTVVVKTNVVHPCYCSEKEHRCSPQALAVQDSVSDVVG